MTIIDTAARREIIRLYVDEQYSLEDVGQVVGCSKTNVYRILEEEHIPRRSGGPSAKTIDPAQVVARYTAGEGIVSLAQDAHCHSSRIRSILADAGITLRSQGLNGRSKSDMSKIPEAGQIVDRYRAGESIQAIATDLRRHLSTVRACINAAGLTIRYGRYGRPAQTWRACHTCNVRISLSDWTDHQYTAHGIETEGAAINRNTARYIAEHQAAWKAQAEAKPLCRGCGYSPCITPICCGRRLRAQAQHHWQKAERRAA